MDSMGTPQGLHEDSMRTIRTPQGLCEDCEDSMRTPWKPMGDCKIQHLLNSQVFGISKTKICCFFFRWRR